jgi:error-prone DNA polymerase
VRLGLRQIKGLQKGEAERLIAARAAGAHGVEALAQAAGLSARTLALLAEADALRGLQMDRRDGLWNVMGLAHEVRARDEAPLLALMGAPAETSIPLPAMTLGAHVAEDYRTTHLSLKAHPCAFFRGALNALGCVRAADLKTLADGRRVVIGGLVLIRQRPGTAKGVVFVTLEDETGSANAVVWADVFAANRRTVMSASFLVVHGRLQKAGEVIHVVAERFTDLSPRLSELKHRGVTKDGGSARPRLVRSRDFH